MTRAGCAATACPLADSTRIEHRASQKHRPDRQLDWQNLLLACPGGDGLHCDARKGERPLRLNPLESVEHRFRYGSNGRVEVDPELRIDVDEVLNLNAEPLRVRRGAAIGALAAVLGRERAGRWMPERLRRKAAQLRERGAAGRFEPYCMALVYWLEKKAAR